MLKNPPAKGDARYAMFKTKGPNWVAWQDVWLAGLRGLRDRDIYAVVDEQGDEPKHFQNKFADTTDDVNDGIVVTGVFTNPDLIDFYGVLVVTGDLTDLDLIDFYGVPVV